MFQRIISVVLCAVMLMSVLPAPAAAEETGNEEPLAVVWTGSDYQMDNQTYAQKLLRWYCEKMIAAGYTSVDGALFVGDYAAKTYDDANESNAGAENVLGILKEKWGLTEDDVIFGSGNHDPAGFTLNDRTGGYERDHYAVYNINFQDYSYKETPEKVQTTASNLKIWLDAKLTEGYAKPIFVMSHMPLHHNGRTENGTEYDSRNARYIVDVLNEAGEKGLNIIYLFGHNHSNGYDGYIGGSCIFYGPGNTMLVYNTNGTKKSDFTPIKLNFTYMNAGYVSYVTPDNKSVVKWNDATSSACIFAIYKDRVVIRRFNKDGEVNLKNAGRHGQDYKGRDEYKYWFDQDEEGNYLWEPDKSVTQSPQELKLKTPVADDGTGDGVTGGGGTGDGETGNEGTGGEGTGDGETGDGGTGDGEESVDTITVYQEWNLFDQQTLPDEYYAAVYRDTMSGVIEEDGNTYQRHTPGIGQVLTLDSSGKLITQDTEVVELIIGEETNRYMLPEDNQLWFSEFATENGEKDLYYLKNQADATKYLAISGSAPVVQEGTSGNAQWRMSSVDYNLFENGGNTIIPNGSGGWKTYNRHNDERTHVYYPAELEAYVLLSQNTAAVEAGTEGTPNLGNVEVYIREYSETEPVWQFPVTIDMLGLNAATLMIPGEYAVENVSWRGNDLGAYTLTVSGGESDFIEVSDSQFASLSDDKGSVPVGTGDTISTGDTLTLFTVAADGTITSEEIPVTVGMLSVTAEELKKAGTYRNLSITFNETVIPDAYMLTVYVKPEDYPEFPDEGAVKIDKWVDTNTYDYYGTGTAQINLSVTGTTTADKSNAVFIVDASSSMRQCVHAVSFDWQERYTDAERALIVAFMETDITRELTSAEKTLATNALKKGINDHITGTERTRLIQVLSDRANAKPVSQEDLNLILNKNGYCTESHKWVGTDESKHCLTREVILEEALVQMLQDFAKPDENGEVPDVDVAIAYFNSYTPVEMAYKMKGKQTEWNAKKLNYNPKPVLDFTNSKNIDETALQNVRAKYVTASGTNFDDALQQAYNLLEEKQAQDYQVYLEMGDTSIPYEPRRDFVVFMSDGDPYQYNYFGGHYLDTEVWPQWYSGTIDEAEAAGAQYTDYVESAYLEAFHEYYHPDGKLWIAEAIKGDKDKTYKIIDPDKASAGYGHTTYVNGLDATIMTVGVNLGEENERTQRSHDCMRRIASDNSYYIKCETEDEIKSAFGTYATLIRSTHNAVFYDQMGAEFDLQMVSSMTTGAGEEVTLNPAPTIQVKKYETWKRGEEGVTEDKIGTRKSQTPTVLETITFKADGTEAYSDHVDRNGDGVCDETDNILIDDVICAANFWYNTSRTEERVIEVGRTKIKLAPETFYWNIGNVDEDELVLSYYVYLTGSMEGHRDEEERNYDTNEYAKLTYINHLGNPCEQSVPTPVLPWKNAVVGYGFYLVNSEGKPIINQTTGETGSFEQAVRITSPVYETFAWNEAGQNILASIVAGDKLPDGYTLFDEGAKYEVQASSDGSGYYQITVTATDEDGNLIKTTYVVGIESTPINGKVNEAVTIEEGKTANSVVWFGVVADVKAVPDTVVIDYGLPVEIDVLANDTMLGANGELEYIGSTNWFADGYAAAKNKDEDLTLWKYLQGYDVSTTPVFTTTNLLYGENGVLRFGDAEIRNAKVRYSIDTMEMSAEDTFVYAVNYTGSVGTQGYYYSTVTVIPATTIYYEDNFVTCSTWKVRDDSPVTPDQWQTVGKEPGRDQAQDRPGEFSLPEIDAGNIYGYDDAYTDMATYSMGAARKFTANKEVYGEAQFTFYGTGFDVISLTSNTTGTITVDVYNADEFKTNGYNADCKTYMVDTYYGYKYVLCEVVYEWDVTELHPQGHWVRISVKEAAAGTAEKPVVYTDKPRDGDTVSGVELAWIVDTSADDTLYQVPVMKVDGLTYGKYTAVITVYYQEAMDHQNEDKTNCYDFYLDAIRIYDPANDGAGNKVIEDAYVADGEGWPEYFELRNLIIKKKDFNNLEAGIGKGIVFIDNTKDTNNNVTYTIEDYTNYGPNNELYLAPGQSVAFNLAIPGDVAGIHLAMKSLGGTANVKYYDADTMTAEKAPVKAIDTATDLYYDITALNNKTVVITNAGNNGDGILSITNIKVTYATQHIDSIEDNYFTVTKKGAETAVASLMMMRPPVDPEEPAPEETEPETTVPEKPEQPAFNPEKFTVRLSDDEVKVGSEVFVTVTTGKDVSYLTINGAKVTKYSGSMFSNTRTWQVRVKAEAVGEMEINVVSYNNKGLASQPVVKTVTVTEEYTEVIDIIRDLIIGFIGRFW